MRARNARQMTRWDVHDRRFTIAGRHAPQTPCSHACGSCQMMSRTAGLALRSVFAFVRVRYTAECETWSSQAWRSARGTIGSKHRTVHHSSACGYSVSAEGETFSSLQARTGLLILYMDVYVCQHVASDVVERCCRALVERR